MNRRTLLGALLSLPSAVMAIRPSTAKQATVETNSDLLHVALPPSGRWLVAAEGNPVGPVTVTHDGKVRAAKHGEYVIGYARPAGDERVELIFVPKRRL